MAARIVDAWTKCGQDRRFTNTITKSCLTELTAGRIIVCTSQMGFVLVNVTTRRFIYYLSSRRLEILTWQCTPNNVLLLIEPSH